MSGSRTLKLSILADVDNLQRNLKTGANDVETFGDKMGKFGKMAGVAFAAAGAAAVAYAGTLAIDGVKAAMEDQAAQEKLALTLKNVTGATDAQIKATADYIDKTSLAYGVTDDELRPSLERLARSTKDVTEAQKLQALALDISAGTGKSLEAVSNALGKAYEGNTGALGKLGVGIDAASLKTMSFDEVTAKLGETFAGQATTKANTFQGKMDRLKIAFDEGKETIGTYLLDALMPLVDWFIKDGIPAIQRMSEWIGQNLMPAFRDMFQFIKTYIIPVFQFLAPLIGTVLVKAWQTSAAAMQTFLGVITKLFSWIGMVIGKVKELAQAFADSPLGAAAGAIADFLIPGRASGGPVAAGSPYVVGEKGPELFVPRTSGTIVPNGATGATTNIYVSGAIDPIGVARQIADLLNREATNSGTFVNLGVSRSFA